METFGRKLSPKYIRKYLRLIQATQAPVCIHTRSTPLRIISSNLHIGPKTTDNLFKHGPSVFSNSIRPLYTSSERCAENEDSEIQNQDKYNDLLKNDPELQNIISDIMHDFTDGTPPNQPRKTKCHEESKDKTTMSVSDKPCETCGGVHKEMPHSIEGKFKVFDDSQTQEVLDFDEEQQKDAFYLYQQKEDKLKNYEFQRGKEGVFDIEELVTVLRQENADDLAVLSVPENLHYCQHLVIVSARSPRHLKALNEFMKKLHKKKKSPKDPFIITEGKNCDDWKVLDMGNIVLHLFLEPTRNKYDLETLWTVGEHYDDLCNVKEDPVLDLLQQHIQYLDDIEILPVAEKQ